MPAASPNRPVKSGPVASPGARCWNSPGGRARPRSVSENRLAHVLKEVVIVVVARQSGDLSEAEPLIEAAVRLGGWTAQVATGRAQGGGVVAERLDQVTADASASAAFDDEEIVEARHAGDHLAQNHADELLPGAG